MLHEQGYGVRTIGKLLGLARNTVRRYLKMEEGWSAAPRPTRRSLLDPYRDYLFTRWMQGEHNGNQLTREIRSQGYQGCDTLVREVTTRLRKTYPDVASLPRTPYFHAADCSASTTCCEILPTQDSLVVGQTARKVRRNRASGIGTFAGGIRGDALAPSLTAYLSSDAP
jgi:hypothetical protein